jgi:hypothetical protein
MKELYDVTIDLGGRNIVIKLKRFPRNMLNQSHIAR